MNEILILPILILFMMLSSTITLFSNYKYYKSTFNELKNKTFYKNKTQIYQYKFGEKSNEFIWFSDVNDFKLKDGYYLLNKFYTYFDLFSLYWLFKYRKWCKENIDLNNIQNY